MAISTIATTGLPGTGAVNYSRGLGFRRAGLGFIGFLGSGLGFRGRVTQFGALSGLATDIPVKAPKELA